MARQVEAHLNLEPLGLPIRSVYISQQEIRVKGYVLLTGNERLRQLNLRPRAADVVSYPAGIPSGNIRHGPRFHTFAIAEVQ